MRRLAGVLAAFVTLGACGTAIGASSGSTPVATQGETRISYSGPALRAEVRIRTHRVRIGKPSDSPPALRENSCTYSVFPCSLVDQVEIRINGQDLFVPRSLFCGIADLGTAEIQASGKHGVLTLHGGDASESFVVKIEFDESRLLKKSLYSGMAEESPLEETVYHEVGLRK